MPKVRPNAVAVAIAAYAALVLGVLAITPLWLDELQQVAIGRQSWGALIEWIQMNPGAAPLPYLEQRAIAAWLGDSVFVARLPAALCSIAGAVVFAGLCSQFGIRRRAWAIAVFLVLPLQFRYALEARGYSQGLLCVVLSLWLFLRARERGTARSAAWYGASVAFGLYSQPLTILPVFGELLWLIGQRDVSPHTKRAVLGAALAGALAFVPWYVLQRQTQEQFGSMSLYFFSWHQVTPLRFLHEISGGGYVCTAALLFAAGAGLALRSKVRLRSLLVSMLLAGLAGPIAIDVLVNYFFAARQLLFAAPALALCAGAGIESLGESGHRLRWAGYAVLLAFLAAAAVSDYRLATVPKDGFGAQARVLEKRLQQDACIAVAPPNHAWYYLYLVPQLNGKVCAEPLDAPRVLAVSSPYSTAAQRSQLSRLFDPNYDRSAILQSGSGQIAEYQRR